MGNPYKYRVPYRRTSDWYTGHWAELSDWCRQCIPQGEWDYYYDGFVFTQEKYMTWFQLRWL